VAIYLGLLSCPGGFDTVLEGGTAGTSKGVCYNGSRDEMIRVQDDHVVRIVDNTFARTIVLSDEVDIRAFRASAIVPGLA
jgi:hypothetical protein